MVNYLWIITCALLDLNINGFLPDPEKVKMNFFLAKEVTLSVVGIITLFGVLYMMKSKENRKTSHSKQDKPELFQIKTVTF